MCKQAEKSESGTNQAIEAAHCEGKAKLSYGACAMIKKTHWRITKHAGETSPWYLESQSLLDDGSATPWSRIGRYRTRKAAITVGMVMRDRGDPISWPGNAVRMGIALVASC